MERIVEFEPAFDKRSSDPKKNYGVHGVQIRFLLKGPEGVVQFLLFTNWQLPHVMQETDHKVLEKASQGVHPVARISKIRTKGFDLDEVEKMLERVTRSIGEERSGLDQIDLEVLYHPRPADLGYYSPKPMYEGQTTMGACQYLDGKPCYYDGSGLAAERVYDVLLREGSSGVWKSLEDYYESTFKVTVNEEGAGQS